MAMLNNQAGYMSASVFHETCALTWLQNGPVPGLFHLSFSSIWGAAGPGPAGFFCYVGSLEKRRHLAVYIFVLYIYIYYIYYIYYIIYIPGKHET